MSRRGWVEKLRWTERAVHHMAEAMRGEGLPALSPGERRWAIARANEIAAAAERQGVNASELRRLAAHLKYGEI
jgi:UDP-N-acetyl-D-mannosaminuronate dehydrogenase